MLKRTQSCRRCSLIPELNLRLVGPTKHFPSEKTSDAMCYHGPWKRLERSCSGGSGDTGGQGTGDALSPLCTATVTLMHLV